MGGAGARAWGWRGGYKHLPRHVVHERELAEDVARLALLHELPRGIPRRRLVRLAPATAAPHRGVQGGEQGGVSRAAGRARVRARTRARELGRGWRGWRGGCLCLSPMDVEGPFADDVEVVGRAAAVAALLDDDVALAAVHLRRRRVASRDVGWDAFASA